MAAAISSVEKVVRAKPGAEGLAVIVTNDYSSNPNKQHLPGTTKDGEAMFNALTGLNFAIYWEKNVSEDKLNNIIRDMQNLEHRDVKKYRCIFFIFSGHGGEGDRIVTEDDKSIDLRSDIMNPLLPKEARGLGRVPRVFLIDACRGDQPTSFTQVPSGSVTAKGGVKTHEANVAQGGCYLLAYATLPQKKCYETPDSGGLWLSRVARLINEGKHLGSFVNLLTEVNRVLEVEQHKKEESFQQPHFEAAINRIIKLQADEVAQEVGWPLLRTVTVYHRKLRRYCAMDRTVKIEVTNSSSLELADCTWYPQHGTHSESIIHNVAPEETSVLIFRKSNVIFFGVSGYIQYSLKRGEEKRNLIVAFTSPTRAKPNKVSVIILDKSDMQVLGTGPTAYSRLKQRNITRLQKRMKSCAFASSNLGNGVSTNPSVDDSDVRVGVRCTITANCAGSNLARLTVLVKDLK